MIDLLKKAIVDLPIRLKGNSKRTSGNSLSPLGAQNKDIGAASQTILTWVRLRQRRRLKLRDRSLFIAWLGPGGGRGAAALENLGLKKVKFSRSPL